MTARARATATLTVALTVSLVALGPPSPGARAQAPTHPASSTTPAAEQHRHPRDGGCAALRGLFGREVRRLPTEEPVVALTFNAAWNEDGLTSVLDTLDRLHAPATFFLTGRFAEQHPGAARRIAARQSVASHSYRHPRLGDLTRQGLREEVEKADRVLRRTTGAAPLPFYRFPYSETTPRAVAEVNALGFADLEFTQDTIGYLGRPAGMTVDKAVARATAALAPGAILQMHVGTTEGSGPHLDSQALPRIIATARARGFRIADLRTYTCHTTVR